jgi:oligopeptidase B
MTKKTSTGKPPVAARREHISIHHGTPIDDPYYWLKDPGYPKVKDKDVLDYLSQENEYFKAQMAPHGALVEIIHQELKARIVADDYSVPVNDGEFSYYWRFEKGAEYRIWARVPRGEEAAGRHEHIILNEAARAGENDFYAVRSYAISSDDQLIAWSEDRDGSERFKILVRDLGNNEIFHDDVANTSGSVVWAEDQHAYYYVELNDNQRPYRVRLHQLGNDQANDAIIYEEDDPAFFVSISKTRSRRYVIIRTGDHVTSELRIIPGDDPLSQPILVAKRQPGHEYDLTEAGHSFYIRTNDTHHNFRVVRATITKLARNKWVEVIAASDKTYIRAVSGFRNFYIVEQRTDALDQIAVHPLLGKPHFVSFAEPVYTAGLGTNADYQTSEIRLNYQSMVTPATVYDYAYKTRQLEVRKVDKVPSGYDPRDFKTERLWATARDGTRIPISIVYRRDYPADGRLKLHLYGYGAYGLGIPPRFSAARLSLLERGFAFAIAHIRGGDEMGYKWYEDGKLEKRTNAFLDFVDCARHLIKEDYARSGNISISGGSAGGSLMGYVINSDAALWRAVVTHVPFVDILNTMLDDSLPLTPLEWPEWGNPITDKAAFNLIRSYSPYDNLMAQDYPPLLVTAGLNDPRVTYWEPAKWVAKMRTLKTDDNLLLLKTNMGAGHQGKSGRYEGLLEVAEEYAFILSAFGEIK